MRIKFVVAIFLVSILSLISFASDDMKLAFKEELRFGAVEDDMEYQWLDAQLSCNFEVTANGHIFVLDQRAAVIYEFDGEGKLLRTAATKGDGPGEYQQIASLSLRPDGSGLGMDGGGGSLKVHNYGPGMKHLNSNFSTNASGFLFKSRFDRSTGIVQMISEEGGQREMRIDLLDKDLVLIANLRTVTWPNFEGNNASKPSYWEDYMAAQFKGFWEIATTAAGFTDDGRLVVADAKTGNYEVWDATHSTKLKSFHVPIVPRNFGEKQKGELVEAISTILFNQMGPSAKSIISDAVLVNAVEKADLPEKETLVIDIFPIEGNLVAAVINPNFATGTMSLAIIDTEKGYLGTVDFPDTGVFSVFGTRLKFANGKVYAMGWSEDGENQMVRYSYDFSQLKK